MKLLRAILLLTMSTYLFAGAKHCIQVTAVSKYKEGEIRSSILNIIENYDKARIDKRGRRHVLRVGDYKDASSAKKDLRKIRREFRDAFIRRCDYDPISAVYPPFEDKDEVVADVESSEKVDTKREEVDQTEVKNNNLEFTEVVDEAVKEEVAPKTVQESFKYKKQEKYNYEFWQECKKCFAPMDREINNDYSDEELADTESKMITTNEVIESETNDIYNDTKDESKQEVMVMKSQYNDEIVENKEIEEDKKNIKESSGFFSWLFGLDENDKEDTDESIEIEVEDVNIEDDNSDNNIFDEEVNTNSESTKNNAFEDIDIIEEETTSYYDK